MFHPPTSSVSPLFEKPSTDAVKTAIRSVLSPDANTDRHAATEYLESLRNSVFAWEVCDQLLSTPECIEVTYLAANMLRQKISRNFHELPQECHNSLKESILNHLQANEDYAVQGQLALAVADLTLLLPSWQNPISDLADRLRLNSSANVNDYSALYKDLHNRLVFANLIHQMCDVNHNNSERPCRIGSKRREEYDDYLISNCKQVITWWLNTYKETQDLKAYLRAASQQEINGQSEKSLWINKCLSMIDKITGQIYLCYSAWLRIFDEENVTDSLPIIDAAFAHLGDLECNDDIHKYAVEVIVSTALYCEDNRQVDYLINDLVTKVYNLEQPFKLAANNEEIEKLSNFTKTFTGVAEIACQAHVIDNKDYRLIELLLSCMNHYDYEIVEETYSFWWTFMDSIQNQNQDFSPYIRYVNSFIMAMTKLYQFDPDEESVVPSDQDIHNFRLNSAELITRAMFVTTFENFMRDNHIIDAFRQNLVNTSWEKIEALLYLTSCLIQMTTSYENKSLVETLNAILLQQTNQTDIGTLLASQQVTIKIGTAPGDLHPQVVATTLSLLSNLDNFFIDCPDYIGIVISYILSAISDDRYRNVLIKPAAVAMSSIMSLNSSKHLANSTQLLAIVKDMCTNLDQYDDNAAGDLLKCSALTANAIKDAQIQDQFLYEIMSNMIYDLKKTIQPPKQNDSEPIKYLDRISSIFRQCNIEPSRVQELKNFVTLVDSELWPSVLKVLEIYASDKGRIIEKACRTIRYILRCIKPDWMIQRVAETMIDLYKTYPQNSSPLYICSILVDEFANRSPEINGGLFAMLDIFCTMTFTLLEMNNTSMQQASQQSGFITSSIQQSSKSLLTMKSYPETIEDMMRLFNRFMKKCPMEFSKFNRLPSIIELSICSLRIDHPEANSNVCKFMVEFIRLGQQSSDYYQINEAIRNVLGSRIVDAVIKACLFDIPTGLINEEAQLLMALNALDKGLFHTWIDATINSLPRSNPQGFECVTMEQLEEFRQALKSSDSMKRLYNSLRAYARLYN